MREIKATPRNVTLSGCGARRQTTCVEIMLQPITAQNNNQQVLTQERMVRSSPIQDGDETEFGRSKCETVVTVQKLSIALIARPTSTLAIMSIQCICQMNITSCD